MLTISVLTPCLNGSTYLREALASIQAQCYPNVEHIVIDGGSTDGTTEILAQYPTVKVLSGTDRGMYDALNKGLGVATGEIVGILNTDDLYADRIFAAVENLFQRSEVMAVAGDAVSFRGDRTGTVDRFHGVVAQLSQQSILGSPAMNAWFFRRSLFHRIGHFDANFRIAGDREFMLRLACSGEALAQLNTLSYLYRIHGGSMTFGPGHGLGPIVEREHANIADRYLHRTDLSTETRRLIKRAVSRDSLRMALRSAQSHQWSDVLRHARRGARHDWAWILRFAKKVVR